MDQAELWTNTFITTQAENQTDAASERMRPTLSENCGAY